MTLLTPLRSGSLRLQPLTLAQLQQLCAGQVPAELVAAAREKALPPPFVLARALARVEQHEPAAWWLPYLMVSEPDGAVVGGCAFKGPPREGQAEILYGVARAFRGRGFAKQAVHLLVRIAFEQGAQHVLAEVEPHNLASARTVAACGFRATGSRVAEDGAAVVQWVLSAAYDAACPPP